MEDLPKRCDIILEERLTRDSIYRERAQDFRNIINWQNIFGGFDVDAYHPDEYHSNEYHSNEYHPDEYHPDEYHPDEYHPDEYHPDEYHSNEYRSNEYHSNEYHSNEYHSNEYHPEYHCNNEPDHVHRRRVSFSGQHQIQFFYPDFRDLEIQSIHWNQILQESKIRRPMMANLRFLYGCDSTDSMINWINVMEKFASFEDEVTSQILQTIIYESYCRKEIMNDENIFRSILQQSRDRIKCL